MPTRAGERARAELATSAELQRVVAMLPAVDRAAVSVRLPADATPYRPRRNSGPRAVATVVLAPGAEPQSTEAAVEALSRHWLGDGARIETVVVPHPSAPEPDPVSIPMLAFALLGLGASAGVAVDRAFDRRRKRRKPGRTR